MSPICVECRLFMTRVKNGVSVLTHAETRPYQLFRADLFECPGCGGQVVTGFGSNPESEHFAPDFAERIERAEQLVKVYDRVAYAVESMVGEQEPQTEEKEHDNEV